MQYSEIQYELGGSSGRVARITLNRPEQRNPLGPVLVSELCHALERARDAPSVRVLILTGAGKVFSAGGDLKKLRAGVLSDVEGKGELPPRTFLDLLTAFTRLGKPVIAMVNGHAMGGGLGLVVSCHLALAAEEALFATPEINVGIWPMMIMANIFRNVGRKEAMRMILTGEKISAARAAQIGLINEAVPAAELAARTDALAEELAQKSPTALRMGLDAFYAVEDLALEPSIEHLERELITLLGTEDAKEGLSAFLEQRAPVFRGQ